MQARYDKCNKRIHGTTRQRPIDVFNEKEKAMLKPLPLSEYHISRLQPHSAGFYATFSAAPF